MRVVCTAGHVDHGKSALVEALTGTNPDRLAEERTRGLTITLGFAWTDLGTDPDVETVAFVDLPGHERFVGNMLAGAGGVDLALLVVAADEGWMPQSAEHLAILDLLGVRHGVVAVSKVDLVDEETAELAVELVRDELRGTSLEEAEIIPLSAKTGQGLDELRAGLLSLFERSPEPADTGRPRLWIDRSFTMAGAGTVVTGTLQGGVLGTGDTVEVLPAGPRARIRAVQQLGRDVGQASPGTRVAVNLVGVEVAQASRGTLLGLPGQWVPTRTLEARLRTLPGVKVGRRGAWKLYAGSGVWDVRLAPLLPNAIEDGDDGHVRIVFDTTAPLTAGDRFVLRDTGRRITAGGGVVLDADPPPRPRGAAARQVREAQLRAREAALAAGDRGLLLARHVTERGSVDPTRAIAAIGLDDARAQAAIDAHGLVEVGGKLVASEALERWRRTVLEALQRHHGANPVERAARRNLPARALEEAGCPADLAPAILDLLVARDVVVAEGPGLRTPEHAPTLDDTQQAARKALLDLLGREPFAPPRLSEAAEESGASEALIRELEAAGELVRLASEIAVTAGTLDEAHRRLAAAFEAEGPLTAARAKEVLGTSRRVALPLLEELDRRRLTRRSGDVRDVIA